MLPRAVRIETPCSFRKYNKELQKIVLFSENLIFLMNSRALPVVVCRCQSRGGVGLVPSCDCAGQVCVLLKIPICYKMLIFMPWELNNLYLCRRETKPEQA